MRRVTHEERVALAEEICNEVKGELREGLRAFVIFASTAKNADGPYSDLELMAIVTDDYEETACGFMRQGAYCEVYYIPLTKALAQAGVINHDWPVAADQWHSMLPVYLRGGDDCLDEIQKAARNAISDEGKFRKETRGRVMGVLEEIGSLTNAWEKGVRSDVCTYLFSFSYSVLILVAFVNKHFYQSWRNAWEESKELENLPRDYVELIEIVHGEAEASIQARYSSSLELWENIKNWIADMGIDWENEGKLEFPKQEER
ncbi:hypothetical protein JXM67_00270 [candidate division WOR-3 bacterium]|nr:hypothetical protein [candidate division WOR-3 bacterium]